MAFLASLPPLVVSVVTRLAESPPEPEDVTAGGTAFVVFMLLVGAVVVLGFSLTKQLRKAQAAKDAGVFGDPVEDPDSDQPPG